MREFSCLGSPVVRTQLFHCLGQDSIPGRGTKILQALQCGQKAKINEKDIVTGKLRESA